MNFIKRSIINLKRRPVKNIILFFIFLLGGVFISISFFLNNSAEKSYDEFLKNGNSQYYLELDYSKMYNSQGTSLVDDPVSLENKFTEKLNLDYYNKLGKNEYVKKIMISGGGNLAVANLKILPEFVPDSQEVGIPNYGMTDYEPSIPLVTSNSPVVDRNTYSSAISYEIVEGEDFSEEQLNGDDNVVIVSKEFKELNNLALNQEFEVTPKIMPYYEEVDSSQVVPQKVKIIGVYELKLNEEEIAKLLEENKESGVTSDNLNDFFNYEKNTIHMPLQSFEKLKERASINMASTEEESSIMGGNMASAYYGEIILNDGRYAPQVQEIIDSDFEGYMVLRDKDGSDVSAYNNSVKGLTDKITFVLVLVIILIIIIIGLFLLLNLRERSMEIGILSAMGAKRKNIMGQMIFEVFIVGVIALTIAVIIGATAANVFGANIAGRAGDLSFDYKVSLEPLIFIYVYLVGIAAIVIGAILPLIYVLQLNPKKILFK